MTVSTEVDQNEYIGNGVTTAFPYTFRVFKKSDLVVTVLDLSQNIQTLILDTNYTVSGVGAYKGGNVTLTNPLASGWKISVSRQLPITQETDLRNQGKFFAEVHEDAFDKLTMLIQRSLRWFNLSLRKPMFISNYYDAQQNKIANLSDATADQDAVNNRTMRSYVEKAIAGVVGGFGWFLQSGIGAIYRTFQDKLRDTVSVKDYGATGDGVTSDSVAFSKAVAACISANVRLKIPSGDYILTQSLLIALTTTKNLSLHGDGSSVTRLFFRGAANGISISTSTAQEWNGGSVHVKGLSLITDNVNIGIALYINQMQITGIPAGSVVTEDVVARGENTHTQQWASGIIYNRTSGTTTRDVEIYGYAQGNVGDGITFLGTSDDISTQHVMDNVRLWFLNRPTVANQYIQGLFYDKVNVFNCNYALAWDASAVSEGQTELHIVNSQFTVNSAGFSLTKIGFITGSNNMFISNNQNTSAPSIFIRLNGCFEYSFVANNFYGGSVTRNIGIEISNSVPVATDQAHYNGLIALNTFDELVDALVIDADSISPRLWRNIYTPTVTNIIANNSTSPVVKEDSVFQYTGIVTFGASNALQRVTVAVPAGLFRQQPELATIHWNGDYVMLGNFLASESSATSLVFGIRRYDGTAFTGGPFSYTIRCSG